MPGGANLNLQSFLWRGENVYSDQEIVSRTHDGIHRYTFADYARRCRKLASALDRAGIERGDRVATFGWNTHWHHETYYGVACMGAQLHMINIMLPETHVQHIVEDAEDDVIIVDPTMIGTLEQAYDESMFESVENYVVMGEEVPETDLEPVEDYESFIADGDPEYEFPVLPEAQPAGMCYTSGTTGKPKGVEYTQKMYWTQIMAIMTGETGIGNGDVELTAVPMFHVSGWSRPFATIAAGAKTVLPGPNPDPSDLVELIESEEVTKSAGVPTVWMGVREYARENGIALESLENVESGGSSTPVSLIKDYREEFDVDVTAGYGMTETSPVTHNYEAKGDEDDMSEEELYELRSYSAGLPLPGLEFKVVDDDGNEVPWDGESLGELFMRAPWVSQEYYDQPAETASAVTEDGFLKTGDIVRVTPGGYVDVVDRIDDLVKSGGEWIASVEVENQIMAHEDVLEAAVVPVDHKRWDERPVAFVALHDDASIDEERVSGEIRELVTEAFPRWWAPDAVQFIDEVPKGSTGKFSKQTLRTEFVDEDVRTLVDENAPSPS